MKRMKRATFTAAALLSCTLAFSGCSLISQAVQPEQSQSGEQSNADAQDQGDQDQNAQGQGDQNGQESSADQNGQEQAGQDQTGGQDTSSDQSTSGSSSSTSSAAGSTGSDSGASSGSQGQVSIGESFEDPEMQDKIEVLSAVRNFESSKRASAIELGGEVVLLEVKITPGQKYSGLIQSGAFKISEDGGADYRYDQTDGLEAEMRAAGYEPFEDVRRRDGGTHQGWLAYVPNEKQDAYTIRYERGPGKVLGTDEKVPEFTTTFDIPSV
ncbi:transcriptional regulator [Brevibacterium sediminis]|uniref:transcriptional regulator n=1 Tax=Brevibacterium sediminis TaxID=1857024 RepID=UPI00111F10B5|nr:transcriptional regulator [Brevibacterium sediminis]MCS4594517.1 transcriptional regulator [Brevibacterium sediminis]